MVPIWSRPTPSSTSGFYCMPDIGTNSGAYARTNASTDLGTNASANASTDPGTNANADARADDGANDLDLRCWGSTSDKRTRREIRLDAARQAQPYQDSAETRGDHVLRVDAVAERLGQQCAEIYFQELNITG